MLHTRCIVNFLEVPTEATTIATAKEAETDASKKRKDAFVFASFAIAKRSEDSKNCSTLVTKI